MHLWSLEDMLDESIGGRDEQEQDTNGVQTALGLAKSTTESTFVVNVLEQQIGTDDERNDIGDPVTSGVDDQVGGRDDEQDEGHRELQVTVNEIGKLLSEE